MSDPQAAKAMVHEPPAAGLWLGLDTGGTCTDAVLLADGRRVVASAKSLTTHWDLAIGIGHAIRAVLGEAPSTARRGDINLVCVSSTPAAKAVVGARFTPACTLLIGFDDAIAARSGVKHHGGALVSIGGGHGATGAEGAALDEPAIER